jgi:hypothetical protein
MMKKRIFDRAAALGFLERLAVSPAVSSRTLYLPPHPTPDTLEAMLKEIPAGSLISKIFAEIANGSPTGAVILANSEAKYLIVPPFPILEKILIPSLDITRLRSLLTCEYIIGLVLVRLGSYALGICRGDKLVSSKVGTGLIHGRHRQGGSSSHRFERHRDKQIEQFLIRVGGHVREQLEPYAKAMDYIVYGGARTTILLCQKYCPFLMKLDKPVLPPLLDIPEPRQAVLESAVSRVWSSTIYEWNEK